MKDNKIIGSFIAVEPIEQKHWTTGPIVVSMPEGFTWGKPYEILGLDDGQIIVINDNRQLRWIYPENVKIYKTLDEMWMYGKYWNAGDV